MPQVFSKLANNQKYVGWLKGGAELPTEAVSVLVMGGAGLADENLVTPMGVMTTVTDEEAAFLETNKVFLTHKKHGQVTIEKRAAPVEKVVANMSGIADPSGPITPSSFEGTDLSPDTGEASPTKVRSAFDGVRGPNMSGGKVKPLSSSVAANKKRK